MHIKNNYSEKIYWRAFKGDDTVYTIGLAQGEIDKGKEGSWRDDSFPQIKVEIKTGDTVFSEKVLARAGQTFSITDDLTVDAKGTLSKAEVSMTGARMVSVKKSDYQFFDARHHDSATPRKIKFSIENAFSASEGFEQAHEHSQTWSVEGKVGGSISAKKGDVKGSGSAEVSVGFEDKVVDSLQNTYQQRVNSVWGQSVEDTITFQPGKLYAIEMVWAVDVQEGTVSYFGESTSFSVVSSVKGSLTTPTAFNSAEEMPDRLKEKFAALVS